MVRLYGLVVSILLIKAIHHNQCRVDYSLSFISQIKTVNNVDLILNLIIVFQVLLNLISE